MPEKRFAEADGLSNIVAAAMTADLHPSCAALSYDDSPHMILLVGICAQLQRHHGDQPFYLSSRTAAKLLGIQDDRLRAVKMLRCLVIDEVLQEVKKGDGWRATRYRFIWGREPRNVVNPVNQGGGD